MDINKCLQALMKSYRKQLPENIAAKGGFYKLLNNGMHLVLQDCTSVIPLHLVGNANNSPEFFASC